MNGTLSAIVDGLKSQPFALALVVTNLALLAYLFYSGHETLTQRNAYVQETQALLAKCVSIDDLERLQRPK